MKILVTGARGFVGLNVTQTLAKRGSTVWAVDRSPVDRWVQQFLSDESDSVWQIVADLSRPGDLLGGLSTTTVDAVVHAAAITATTSAVEQRDARAIVDTNIGGTIEALQVALALDVERFVYVSSPSAIGDVESAGPVDESVIPHPTTLYGITKHASEQIVERWRELYGLEAASIRIAQPYGPGERTTTTRVRTSPIWEWLRDARPGVTLPTGPLGRQRDWTYVSDTAEGIVRVVEADQVPHGLYHLGLGVQTSVEDVLNQLRAHVGHLEHNVDPEPDALNPNLAGRGRPALDSSRFAADFGWRPQTPFDIGMVRYIQWWTRFRELVDGV